MEILIFISYCILFWYLLNIFWLIVGFSKVPVFRHKNISPKTTFSIIVPFRNEADNLPRLLASFEKLNYPHDLFEVILVDDESDEKYKIQNTKYKIHLLNNIRKSNSPKKDAINTAIVIAKNNWIVTTDADCEVPKNWLISFNALIQENESKMIASGVIYNSQNSFLENFQQLDLLSLQGTTIGSFGNQQAFMCNGANLCYEKSFFLELNGFEGNENIASGDDVFLLQKAISKNPEAVRFLKSSETVVSTKPEKSWKKLFHQRVRWASKTANYKSFYSKQLGISVFITNTTLVIIILCFWLLPFQLVVWYFSLKFLIDFILLRQTAAFLKQPIRYLIISSLLYAFFSSVVVLYSFFGSYNWKGRSFKK